ncbi:hypothetical protein SEUBUCD646_0D02450 [Saccharomyces eubayanus]|uniref:Zn(2)-C6 fungal-type domain-containing protein n=1 Tax=Saccharomyces eubayanus TaxID=1080349 RepID=A0ABN8VTL4_SACEU|nr:hypothetical protein SEUBUCD650_0D02440 [Saccharomyces eubayanus]CAI1942328.1 hypothetical protein SEUBUCD646_0D02450 [Saccharomyces eubayanus]
MSQHAPINVYDEISSPYERPNIVTSMGGENWRETRRNCKPDSRKITKQRKKASRACDQCRKKRIKCEYNQHTRVCQGCFEVGQVCLFVRVPLKRGPTKKKTQEIASDKMSSVNNLLNYRPRTHSYPVSLESVRLPSLSQNFSFPTTNSLCVSPMPAQSQPFWKVPYDDVQRRSSLSIFSCDSTSSIGAQENYHSDQDSTVKQRGRKNTGKGIITPVEDKYENSPGARSQHLDFPQFQEQRAKPFLNNCGFGNPRTNSLSCPSDGALSKRNSRGSERYMLTPNSVHSAEKERSSSLTIRSLDSKFDIDDNIHKWQNNSAWAPAYILSDPSRPGGERKVLSNRNADLESAVFSSSNDSAGGQFSEISFLKLIDIYYDFFHINLPIVPINKSKLISLFVPIMQPINHQIMKINNEIIRCFKDALEVLVFSAIKQRKSSTSWPHDNACDFQKGLYYAQNFRKCVNECFQSIMTVKSKLKINSTVIPSRVKFIYFSTIVILNYILVLTGDEHSSLLGPSVGVFNEFQSHKLFLPLKNITSMPLLNSNQNINNKQLDCAILFQRLYILLSILDSIQSFRLGQPKLINLKFGNPVDSYFRAATNNEHLVEQNPTILDNILRNLKLGGFMTDFVFGRKSLQINSSQNILTTAEVVWENITRKNNEPDDMTGKFQTLLREKENLIKRLINMKQKDQLLENCCDPNVKTNAVAETVCLMINLVSDILVSIVNTNPENLVDYTLKVVPNIHSALDKEEEPMSPKQSNIHSLCNSKARNYANESTPSIHDAENGRVARKWTKGTVSVFILPIVEECYNIVHLVGSIPSTLINLYIRNGNMATETNAKIMMLSTALSELVQITELSSKLGPPERKISITNKHINADIARSSKDFRSVMKDLYLGRHAVKNAIHVVPPEDESTKILSDFSNIGWKLMDDSELGCCHRPTN